MMHGGRGGGGVLNKPISNKHRPNPALRTRAATIWDVTRNMRKTGLCGTVQG